MTPNQTGRGHERIFDEFIAQAQARPDAPAILHAGGAWTYGELERASRRLAQDLSAAPLVANPIVAIMGHRRPELVVAMLACLRAGLTFAVLDTAYPTRRLVQLVGVVNPGRFIVLDPASWQGREPERAPEDEALRLQLRNPDRVFQLDEDELARLRAPTASDDAPLLDTVAPTTPAYLLFTSGTTGTPKCIATNHRPLVHFVSWYVDAFAVRPASRFSLLSGLGHDPVLRDVFVPLSVGAQLHIPDSPSITDPARLCRWVRRSQVSHVHLTPQLARVLCAGARDGRSFILL